LLEQAHAAVEHPHVIEHALRQLGVEDRRAEFETRPGPPW
jgi:hypothetical protein